MTHSSWNFHILTKNYSELVEDGACSPAVVESEIGQIVVYLIAEVQNGVPNPARHLLQLVDGSLYIDFSCTRKQLKS